MKFKITLLLLLALSVASCAQTPKTTKPLTIGDRMPDILISNILNHKTSAGNLSDFGQKAFILDFFATWCGACISELPRLDILQKQFGDSLQVLIISQEPPEKIKAFLKNNAKARNLTLPFIAGDSIFNKLFPHRLVPHEVWIDSKGIVKAITRADYVTGNNLQSFINGEPLHLPLKKDILNFSVKEPLLKSPDSNGTSNILYRSTLSRYLNGAGSLTGTYRDSTRVKYYNINVPILALYNNALNGLGNRVILEVRDSSRYIYDGSQLWALWAAKNCYCYEIIGPPSTSDSTLHAFMLDDLNKYLGLNGRKANRTVNCWSLVRTISSSSKRLKTKSAPPDSNLNECDASVKYLHNQPLYELVKALNAQIPGAPLKPIIIDETNYKNNIDIKLSIKNINNIKALRKALYPYGLDLISVTRELEMFVLSENGSKSN